jgi:uncharacterized membrane protein YedE/YeeE
MINLIDRVVDWIVESPWFFPCIAIAVGGFLIGLGIVLALR